MKFLIFILLIAAISAAHLATDPNAWNDPSEPCAELLNSKVDNEDGKLVLKAGGANYHQTCDDILINRCTLYASCKDRNQKYKMATLKLTGTEFEKTCCA
jgi:hypothetical protein